MSTEYLQLKQLGMYRFILFKNDVRWVMATAFLFVASLSHAQSDNTVLSKPSTICNPLNLSYRFYLDSPSRREAADPTMITFKGEYYLFASKSGGYWHSSNLINWDFITTKDLPLEDYAPTVVVIGDTLYFTACSVKPTLAIYKSGNPKAGKWQVANAAVPLGFIVDPCLFLDDDGRLYLYYGCSDVNPIYGIELDRKSLNPIGKPKELFNCHFSLYGWERPGDYNEIIEHPWIEGSWMNKYKGKYYLQYASPGTQFKSYSDGVYVSDNPLGPFVIQGNNPYSSKPEGFIAGAGHGSTFMDKYGNYWHIATMTISQKHMFERRLGLFPAFFDKDGMLSAYTGFGDFPYHIPSHKIADPKELFANWMLLSYKKDIAVSSELPDHPGSFATDENIRTYWSAKTGNKGEWLSMDLQQICTINALQLNFAENQTDVFGRSPSLNEQYVLQYSTDGKTWQILVDSSNATSDLTHNYFELKKPVTARYIKVINYHIPSGTFALSDLRVFGNAYSGTPGTIDDFKVDRSEKDRTKVKIVWKKNGDAIGYNIRYGSSPDKLYHNYQVLDTTSIEIRSLNANEQYYFSIDAFDEKCVSTGKKVVMVK